MKLNLIDKAFVADVKGRNLLALNDPEFMNIYPKHARTSLKSREKTLMILNS